MAVVTSGYMLIAMPIRNARVCNAVIDPIPIGIIKKRTVAKRRKPTASELLEIPRTTSRSEI